VINNKPARKIILRRHARLNTTYASKAAKKNNRIARVLTELFTGLLLLIVIAWWWTHHPPPIAAH